MAEYEVLREGQEEVLRVDANKWPYSCSIEDNASVMNLVIGMLADVPHVSRLIINQRRNYGYDYEQTQMLIEVANLYNHLSRQKKITYSSVGPDIECNRCFATRYADLQYILNNLKADPIGAYVELKRTLRNEEINLKKQSSKLCVSCIEHYNNFLNEIIGLADKLKIIEITRENLAGYRIGDRTFYREILRPTITPDFMFTRLMLQVPSNAEQIDVYSLENAEINIYKVPGDVRYFYHLTPVEFKLTEDKYMLLDLARSVVAEHKPREEEFLDPERMRRTFFNIGRDLIMELAQNKGISLSLEETEQLAKILVRYTVGFGLVEVLLEDEKIQDIVINGPIGQTPIFIVHQDFEECVTNIIPSSEDAESWASKFRLLSGRPLDEANPVLDTELTIPSARARVAVITNPLNPFGLGYSLRRHRDKPWTYPLYIKNKMLNPLAAGLLSFLVDGSRSILFGGTRSSGKTSLLGATLLEIMRKYRLITVEDTLELPNEALRKLGYNIQAMKVRAALMSGGAEVPADEGIRTSLRMGDSSLIVGEIRSLEAMALFESMRIGALANVVAGTIHGADPYSIFDRVVNDLKVPRTSFKAVDVIIVSNPIKSSDGLHKWKRVLQIAEVRKHWEEDPLREGGFVDLMTYDSKEDILKPSKDLINGDSETLKSIAGNVKEWAGNWDAIWENILLRSKIKETLVNYAEKTKLNEILEAGFVVNSNDMFHRISDEVREEVGYLDSKMIFDKWDKWVRGMIK